MTSGSEDVPPGLINKDDIVFGNIQDIYEFHNRYEGRAVENYQSLLNTFTVEQEVYESYFSFPASS